MFWKLGPQLPLSVGTIWVLCHLSHTPPPTHPTTPLLCRPTLLCHAADLYPGVTWVMWLLIKIFRGFCNQHGEVQKPYSQNLVFGLPVVSQYVRIVSFVSHHRRAWTGFPCLGFKCPYVFKSTKCWSNELFCPQFMCLGLKHCTFFSCYVLHIKFCFPSKCCQWFGNIAWSWLISFLHLM